MELFGEGKWQNSSSLNITQDREFVWVDLVGRPQKYKGLYGILLLLKGSPQLDNFLLKTLKLGWIAFRSLTFQLKCLDFQSNQYRKLMLKYFDC